MMSGRLLTPAPGSEPTLSISFPRQTERPRLTIDLVGSGCQSHQQRGILMSNSLVLLSRSIISFSRLPGGLLSCSVRSQASCYVPDSSQSRDPEVSAFTGDFTDLTQLPT